MAKLARKFLMTGHYHNFLQCQLNVILFSTGGVSPPHSSSDPYHGMNQMTAPTVPQSYGERSAVMGADMMGRQEFTRHSGGRSAPSYSEDTGAAMQPHMNQNFGQQFSRQPAAGQLYGQRSSSPYSPPSEQYSSPGITQHRPAAVSESFPDIEVMKKSGGLLSTGKQSEEMAPQMSGSKERFIPAMASGLPNPLVLPNTSPNYKSSPLSSGDLSAYSGQRPVQPTLDAATPYQMYGDTARLGGAKPDQDFSGSSSGGITSANMTVSRENDLGAQKPGINLQNLGGMEDTAAQERIKALEEKLLKTEQERDESRRSMERSNAVLNNRIRRLEDQLSNITGANSEVS